MEREFLSLITNKSKHPQAEDEDSALNDEEVKFQIHQETLYIDKVVTKSQKLLYSVGKDISPTNANK